MEPQTDWWTPSSQRVNMAFIIINYLSINYKASKCITVQSASVVT